MKSNTGSNPNGYTSVRTSTINVFSLEHIIRFVIMSLLFLATFPNTSYCKDWFVRPESSVSLNGTGLDWDNAFQGFSFIPWDNISCGDTIWIAGGEYRKELSPKKKCAQDSPLRIFKARNDSDTCIYTKGWSTQYNTDVVQILSGISMESNNSYIYINGRKSISSDQSGWKINYKGSKSCSGIKFGDGFTYHNNSFEYLTLEGPGNIVYAYRSDIPPGTGGRGIDMTVANSPIRSTGNTFRHLKIYDWASGIYCTGVDNTIFEYIDMYDISAINSAEWHPNGIYLTDSNNGVVRYSKFHKGPNMNGTGEGIFFAGYGTYNGWKIYGNEFYDLDLAGQKGISIRSSVTVDNMIIANNTFSNVRIPVYIAGICLAGSTFANNLLDNVVVGNISCGGTSNNLYINDRAVFVDRSSNNYNIVSSIGSYYPRDLGIDLGLHFKEDIGGQIYGSDGKWDVGAHEYISVKPKTPDQITIK